MKIHIKKKKPRKATPEELVNLLLDIIEDSPPGRPDPTKVKALRELVKDAKRNS